MLLPVLAIIAGFIILVLGSDRFVAAAAALARHFGLPPLLIGVIIIGFGTSLPEMLVSATGALQGTPGIALGNAYGSNISNLLLILGSATLISTLRVSQDAVRREMPLLLGATALTLFLISDGVISRLDAIVLLVYFAFCMVVSIRHSLAQSRKGDLSPGEKELKELEAESPSMRPAIAAVWVVAGLILMLISSDMLVWGAVAIAKHFGVSDLIIGLTIVAIGTSLPELASTIAATRRGEDDLAVGNIIGSNNFNTLIVVGLAGIITPLQAEPDLLRRDMPIMTAATVLVFIFCRFRPSKNRLTRPEGAALLVLYFSYTAYLVYDAMKTAIPQ